MTTTLRDKVVVVTGSGQGIGRAVSIAAAAQGARVVGLERDAAFGESMRQEITAAGGAAWSITCDVGQLDQLEAAFDRIAADVGPVDVLVNNAARGSHTKPHELTPEEWHGVIDVTLGSMVFASQFASRSMIPHGGGSIVNITSIGGLAALGRGNFAYSTAKAGVVGLTRELAVEWAGFGIRVNAVAPSQVNTPAFASLIGDAAIENGAIVARALEGIPLGRLAETADIVDPVLFLAGDGARFITGVTLPVDGGSLALHAGGSIGGWNRPDRKEAD